MKRLIPLLCLLGAFNTQAAELAADAGLAEVRDLGRLNGQALSCSYAEAAARIKRVIIERAPKSRRYGAAFEESTNQAFLEQSRLEPSACPDGPTLSGKIDQATQRLQAAIPAAATR